MDNTNREIIKLYDQVSTMQKDFAESVKEIYNTISDSLDKIDVPANVSELVNDLKYTTESTVDEKINNIEFDDSNFLL